jgi:hypothetical protein
VVIADEPLFNTCILHFDSKGKELSRHAFQTILPEIYILNERIVAVCESSKNLITLINMKSKEVTHIKHNFMQGYAAPLIIKYQNDIIHEDKHLRRLN